jgi:hypothetical protein
MMFYRTNRKKEKEKEENALFSRTISPSFSRNAQIERCKFEEQIRRDIAS